MAEKKTTKKTTKKNTAVYNGQKYTILEEHKKKISDSLKRFYGERKK